MLPGIFSALELGLFLLKTYGSEEGLKVVEEILVGYSQIPVEEEEKLLFHKVNFGDRETETLVAFHRRIPSPVFILRGAVIQVLGRQDERSEENAVDCATHPFGDWR